MYDAWPINFNNKKNPFACLDHNDRIFLSKLVSRIFFKCPIFMQNYTLSEKILCFYRLSLLRLEDFFCFL